MKRALFGSLLSCVLLGLTACYESNDKLVQRATIDGGEVVLGATLHTAELRVENDHLANDVATLEGRRKNPKQLALDQAWLSNLQGVQVIDLELQNDKLGADEKTQEQVDNLRAQLFQTLSDVTEKLHADVGGDAEKPHPVTEALNAEFRVKLQSNRDSKQQLEAHIKATKPN